MKVCVEVSLVDEKFQFDISAHKSLSIEDIRSILVGGVCLTIHSEGTPKEQAQALKEVIEYMEDDFIDINSFNDVVFPKHSTDVSVYRPPSEEDTEL